MPKNSNSMPDELCQKVQLENERESIVSFPKLKEGDLFDISKAFDHAVSALLAGSAPNQSNKSLSAAISDDVVNVIGALYDKGFEYGLLLFGGNGIKAKQSQRPLPNKRRGIESSSDLENTVLASSKKKKKITNAPSHLRLTAENSSIIQEYSISGAHNPISSNHQETVLPDAPVRSSLRGRQVQKSVLLSDYVTNDMYEYNPHNSRRTVTGTPNHNHSSKTAVAELDIDNATIKSSSHSNSSSKKSLIENYKLKPLIGVKPSATLGDDWADAELNLFDKAIFLGVFPSVYDASRAHDRALIRAKGPANIQPSDLNFELMAYLEDSIESFTKFDNILKRELFGTSWSGPKTIDFAFLLSKDQP